MLLLGLLVGWVGCDDSHIRPRDGGATDARVDAGSLDGGSDAGPADADVDAGADAGRLDGGPLDGGPLDGGALDGGPLDGGRPDAATDAGPRDGGLDAGDAAVDAGVDPDDPDADGVPTSIELACGTDPMDGADSPQPDVLRGAGTDADPYRICLPQHLARFASTADVLTASAALGDDLDMTGVGLGPAIGTESEPFVGVLRGHGHVIDALEVGTAADRRAGIFAHIGEAGRVEDIVFTGARSFAGSVLVDRNAGTLLRVTVAGSTEADNHVGLVVNRNLATGVVRDASSEGSVVATRSHVGGLAGRNDGLIERCFSLATVRGDNRTGGLVGSGAGTVRQSFAAGAVEGARKWVGGLVGSARDGARIEDAYALGDVRANAGEAGGVLGNIEGSAALRRVYAQNTVDGSVASGGVLGVDSSGGDAVISTCYFDSGRTASDPVCTPRSAAELTVSSGYPGFEFPGVWQIDAAARPTAVLAWE